ncbi:MAG: protein phosphatase 2C domain-containing protein [Gammaproteobacteria bacterium]|nr:protein phosphatase 2C domain-containing protein [Gammaproteobacteria bacterium]
MADKRNKPLLLTERVSAKPVHMELAGGEAVVCSFRSPDKDSPNEDAAVIVPLSDTSAILAVADGVGGSRQAQTASAEIVKSLSRIDLEGEQGDAHTRAAIVNAIERANKKVCESHLGSATTLAVAEIADHQVRPIHIGDSAVLVIGQRRKLHLQTVSHSPIGYAVEAGVMDEGEAMHHEDRHLVSNVIGADDMRIEIGHKLALARRDTVVLVTDGVLDNLHIDELIEMVRKGSLMTAAHRVMDAVQKRMTNPAADAPSKPDDTTMILYRRRH